mgnify:CR=1 FL=1
MVSGPEPPQVGTRAMTMLRVTLYTLAVIALVVAFAVLISAFRPQSSELSLDASAEATPSVPVTLEAARPPTTTPFLVPTPAPPVPDDLSIQ